MDEITNERSVPVATVVGITILTAIIFGAGAYLYVNNSATEEKDTLNAQIATLQNEVLSAKKAATITSDSSVPATNADDEVTSTEKSSVPADWKTYKNTKYEYSLDYPNNSKLLARDENLNNTTINPAVAEIIISNDESGFIFSATSKNIQFTTDEIKSSFPETDPSNITLTPTTIAGNPAYQVKYDTASDGISDLYFVKNPSGVVLRLMIARNDSAAQKILSSFAFEE
ncbi:MAG: hypothetical protein PHX30_02695 [Candidatus Pacebacteria bacterium]|jgi:hypothetical protein|nr:hypothetical protein [Candidatus Paceibacterota bacterium]